jgi:hypothetical protein
MGGVVQPERDQIYELKDNDEPPPDTLSRLPKPKEGHASKRPRTSFCDIWHHKDGASLI